MAGGGGGGRTNPNGSVRGFLRNETLIRSVHVRNGTQKMRGTNKKEEGSAMDNGGILRK